jgi:hypothetical protein
MKENNFTDLMNRIKSNEVHTRRQKKAFVRAKTADAFDTVMTGADDAKRNAIYGDQKAREEFQFLYECTNYNIENEDRSVRQLWFPYETIKLPEGTTKRESYAKSESLQHPDHGVSKHFGSCPYALYSLLHLDTETSFNTSCDTLNYLASRYPEEDNGFKVSHDVLNQLTV